MKPYAELLEFNQPNPIRLGGFTRIRDSFPGLRNVIQSEHPTVPEFWSVDSGPSFGVQTQGFYDPERIMEFAGRGDYGENNQRKLGEVSKSGEPILRKYIDMNHQSMIEFGWATFYMEFSRVVLAELTRHRLASYQVESQRFVKYGDELNLAGMFYFPEGLDEASRLHLEKQYGAGYHAYQEMREAGVAPQDARYVLPNGFKTRMCMAANVREWRHIINLRLDKSAQPEIRELMQQVYDQLVMVFPNALYGVNDGRGPR